MDILAVIKIDLETLKEQVETVELLLSERLEDIGDLEDDENVDRYNEDISSLDGLLSLLNNLVKSLERLDG